MDPALIVETVTTLGLTTALVVFFVWVGWKREDRLSTRIEELELRLFSDMSELLKSSTTAMAAMTESLRDVQQEVHENHRCLKAINENLNTRPCALYNEQMMRKLGIDPDERHYPKSPKT